MNVFEPTLARKNSPFGQSSSAVYKALNAVLHGCHYSLQHRQCDDQRVTQTSQIKFLKGTE